MRGLLEQRITTPEQHKWIAKLVGFDYEIFYRPGKENTAADALSRKVVTGDHSSLMTLSAPITGIWEEIATVTKDDDEFGPLLQ